ncbi:MAG: hypothetical protein ACPG7F_15080 [Aggregatilineales bacterium]
MTFNRERIISMIATGLGFLIAALAGLFLAGQAGNENTDILLPGALVSFVFVMPFFVFGMYMYILSVRRENAEPITTDMSEQRRLFDVVRENGCMTLSELAGAMQLSRFEIESELEEMLLLRIFTAHYSPSTETICSEDKATLLQLSSCRVCQAAIKTVEQQIVTCATCGTQYVVS